MNENISIEKSKDFFNLFKKSTLFPMILMIPSFKNATELMNFSHYSHMTIQNNLTVLRNNGFINQEKKGVMKIISLTELGQRYHFHLNRMLKLYIEHGEKMNE